MRLTALEPVQNPTVSFAVCENDHGGGPFYLYVVLRELAAGTVRLIPLLVQVEGEQSYVDEVHGGLSLNRRAAKQGVVGDGLYRLVLLVVGELNEESH